ncbi:glycosyltransferase family 2 protein [Candidatus Daviesbacteria bacterium]|nr:glycosyltransferase family 2 protein [Candidatus Daviesbacteria bacterium]
MSTKISATIVTLNEEENIGRCLNSIKDLVSEIVVVDSGSTDKTIEIAKKEGAKIYNHVFTNFADQKNFALSKTSEGWILSLDADEEIPEELAQEIQLAVEGIKYNGYLIPRKNFILGAQIKHSWWSPDAHIWLWRKGMGKWVGKVHEEVVVEGEVGRLKNQKNHYQSSKVEDFIESNNLYSTIMAKQLFEKNKKFSLFNMFFYPSGEFFIRYFYKLGFLDGWRGFALSYLMSVYWVMVWVKLYEIQRNK